MVSHVAKMNLIDDEEVLQVVKPHPLSFSWYYAIWLYVLGVGVAFTLYSQELLSILEGLPLVPRAIPYLLLWYLAILVPGIIIALLRIHWKWLALFTVIAAGIHALTYYFVLNVVYQNAVLALVGVVGLAGTELYRLSHSYIMTNFRIVTETGFIGTQRRTLIYSKINDLTVEKSLLGRLFNYGTIIPITASGMGLGDDFSFVAGGVGGKIPGGPGAGVAAGGGQSVNTPKGRTPHILFGVPRPEEVQSEIFNLMHSMEEGHYLQKISKDIEELVQRGEEDTGDQGQGDTA